MTHVEVVRFVARSALFPLVPSVSLAPCLVGAALVTGVAQHHRAWFRSWRKHCHHCGLHSPLVRCELHLSLEFREDDDDTQRSPSNSRSLSSSVQLESMLLKSSLVLTLCFTMFLYLLFVCMMRRSILRCADCIILSCSLVGAHVPDA